MALMKSRYTRTLAKGLGAEVGRGIIPSSLGIKTQDFVLDPCLYVMLKFGWTLSSDNSPSRGSLLFQLFKERHDHLLCHLNTVLLHEHEVPIPPDASLL